MKIFTLMAFAMSLFVSHLDGVGMSPLAFKNVNQFFRPGLEYNSPIFGCAALNTGVIENLRFFNVHPAYKVDGNRDYINDNVPGNEPIMEMVKILFPSPVGLLASETSSSQNFGRYCGPEQVASLLNFCHKIRTFFRENPTAKLPKAFGKALVRLRFNDENINRFPQDPFSKTPKSRLLKNILLAIKNELSAFAHENAMSDDAPETAQSFYPQYFPEQIITAFFCHKFADQNDIKKFLNALSPEIVNEDMVQNINTLIDAPLSQGDLVLALKKAEDFLLDDLWLIVNREEFYRVLPYRSGKPISNGLAQLYDRATDRFCEDAKESFPDCVEVALRHIINFFLYDSDTRGFNLSYLNHYVKGKQSATDYIKNLNQFYGFFGLEDMALDTHVVQTPDKANAGSELIRSAWNRVVADLQNPNIIYSRPFGSEEKTNELSGTMLNLTRVLNALFDLDLGPEPAYEEGQDSAFLQATLMFVADCFKKLCKVLNPKLECEIDFSDVCIRSFNEQTDIAGNIHICAFKDGQEHFKAVLLADVHSEIISLTITPKDIPAMPEWAINDLKRENTSKATYASLSSLDSQALAESPISIYKLLAKTIDDPDSAVESLSLMTRFPIHHTRLITQNILKNFLWEDHSAIQKISPVIRDIYKDDGDYFNCLKDFVLGLALEDGDSPEFISQVKNIKHLICGQENGIKDVIIPEGMDSLEWINLSLSEVRKVTLGAVQKLKIINLFNTSNLEELVIPDGMDSLEVINLRNSGVRKITLAATPKLKIIDLSGTKNLEELVISDGMESLEEIDLLYSGVKKVTLAAAPKLKLIRFEGAKNLEELEIPAGMNSLEEIDLLYSGVKKVTFAAALKLKRINLGSTQHLQELEIPAGMDSLEEIFLRDSRVKKITLAAAPQLQSIYCGDRCEKGKIKITGVSLCPQLNKEKLLKFAILKDDEFESCKRKRSDEAGENPEKRQKREKSDDSDDMDIDENASWCILM